MPTSGRGGGVRHKLAGHTPYVEPEDGGPRAMDSMSCDGAAQRFTPGHRLNMAAAILFGDVVFEDTWELVAAIDGWLCRIPVPTWRSDMAI